MLWHLAPGHLPAAEAMAAGGQGEGDGGVGGAAGGDGGVPEGGGVGGAGGQQGRLEHGMKVRVLVRVPRRMAQGSCGENKVADLKSSLSDLHGRRPQFDDHKGIRTLTQSTM